MKINAEKSSVKEWLSTLSAASRGEHYPALWKRVHRLVEVPARRRKTVNLSQISRNSKEGANVIVPGKVLSEGSMDHKVTIAAMEFSKDALAGLNKAGCRVVSLKEMIGSKKVQVII